MRRLSIWLGIAALLLVALALTPWGLSAYTTGPVSVAHAQGQYTPGKALQGVPLRNDWWAGLPGTDATVRIQPSLRAGWESNPSEQKGFVVYLKAQADTTNSITDWNAKGEYVLHQLETVAGATQPSVVQAIAAQQAAHNVSRFTRFTIVNAVFVMGNMQAATQIAALDEVAYVAPDTIFYPDSEAPSASAAPAGSAPSAPDAVEPGIAFSHAPQAWAMGYTGQGIVIGSVDTGVEYTHEALNRQYRGNLGGGNYDHNYNWWDSRADEPRHPTPYDDNGHGTHTTGTELGEDPAQVHQIGMAPGAKWIAAKVFPNGGGSGSEELLPALDFMLAPWDLNKQNRRPDLRPNVINNSWGSTVCLSTDYWMILQSLIDAGIIPIFSNGNNGPGARTVGSPGGYPFLTGVGAISVSTGGIAGFSSRGPSCWGGALKPDVVAPGVNIISSIPGNTYGSNQGTSMAAPHVTGETALILSANPSLTYTEVRSIITRTTFFSPTWGTRPNNNYGWGAIRADAAIDMALHGAHVHGTVTGPLPIYGATIAATRTSDNDTYSTISRPDGTYSMTLLAGTYNFTATAFGFHPMTVGNVVVLTDTSPLRDFALTPLATHAVYGQLFDSACSPISGTVSINPPGTLTVTNDPVNGYYSVNLPAGTYTFVARSGAYLQPITETVTVNGLTQRVFTFGPAHDNANTYVVDHPAYSWISGTTQIDMVNEYMVLTLPFTFHYYGADYTSIMMSAYGFATFNAADPLQAKASDNTEIPNPGPTPPGYTFRYPNNAIYAYWDDVEYDPPNYAGTAWWGVSGTAPNRVFVMEWRDVTGQGDPISFEIQMEETTNKVSLVYHDVDAPYGYGYQSTEGIESTTGNDGIQIGYNWRGVLGNDMTVRFSPGSAPAITPCAPNITPTPGAETPTPTVCPITFTDVPPENTFYPYIRCLACRSILGGYADNTFRPNNNITRGQIAKIVSNAAGFDDDVTGRWTYTDVPDTNTFWTWIERLTIHGVMSGYNCGVDPNEPCDPQNRAYFRWANNATRAQLAKIDSNAAGYSETPTGQAFTDVDSTHPFYLWIERLAERGIMGGYACGGVGEPCDPQNRPYFRPYNNVTRGQAAKIVANTFYPNCYTPGRR